MEEQVEKSCWGITAWAVGIVVAVVTVAGLVSNPPHVERAPAQVGTASQQANVEAGDGPVATSN